MQAIIVRVEVVIGVDGATESGYRFGGKSSIAMNQIRRLTNDFFFLIFAGIFAAMAGVACVHFLTKPMDEKITLVADESGAFVDGSKGNGRYEIQVTSIKPETMVLRVTRNWSFSDYAKISLIMIGIIIYCIKDLRHERKTVYSIQKAKNHPLYARYIQQDPERQFQEDLSMIKDFAHWLKTQS